MAIVWLTFVAAGSSFSVSVNAVTVDPDGIAAVSMWRYVSLSDWPALAPTGKSPAGTSGAGTAATVPTGGGSGSG